MFNTLWFLHVNLSTEQELSIIISVKLNKINLKALDMKNN